MFRKVSLDRLSSPEQLDKRITVVSPIGWVAVVSLAFLILAAITWGYFGLISNKVYGSGVLMYSTGIEKITSQGSGRVVEVMVKGGDYVEEGQVIARVEQKDLDQQLKQVRENIAALETLSVETLDLDTNALTNEVYSEFVQLAGQIRSARAQHEVQRAEAKKSEQDTSHRKEQQSRQIYELRRQISMLRDSVLRQLEEDLAKANQKLEEGALLFNSGAISKKEYDEYGEEVTRIKERINARQQEIGAGGASGSDTTQSRPDFDSQLESLRLQLTMAETELAQLNANYSEYIWGAYNQTSDQIAALLEQFTQRQQVILQDYSKRLKDLETQYSEGSMVTAKSSGIVSGLIVHTNDYVQLGEVLGNIVRGDLSSDKSDVILYVPLDKGKLVEAGMDVYISPTTVKREEHGYIIGKVLAVSATSVTQDHMMSTLQNMQLVQSLSMNTAVLEVDVELVENGRTVSGYQWSTPKGAPFAIRPGTICGGEIVVSNQRPIERVVPFFKGLFR